MKIPWEELELIITTIADYIAGVKAGRVDGSFSVRDDEAAAANLSGTSRGLDQKGCP